MLARMLATTLGIATLSLSLGAVAADPSATPGIDKRMDNQQRRIDKGVESGQLTPREANRLERRQDRIQGDIDQAKSDGVVTGQERRQINRELNRSSGAIARQKHDAQHDYNHDGKADRVRR